MKKRIIKCLTAFCLCCICILTIGLCCSKKASALSESNFDKLKGEQIANINLNNSNYVSNSTYHYELENGDYLININGDSSDNNITDFYCAWSISATTNALRGNSFIELSSFTSIDNYYFLSAEKISGIIYFLVRAVYTSIDLDIDIYRIDYSNVGNAPIYDSNGNILINNTIFYSQQNYNTFGSNQYNNGFLSGQNSASDFNYLDVGNIQILLNDYKTPINSLLDNTHEVSNKSNYTSNGGIDIYKIGYYVEQNVELKKYHNGYYDIIIETENDITSYNLLFNAYMSNLAKENFQLDIDFVMIDYSNDNRIFVGSNVTTKFSDLNYLKDLSTDCNLYAIVFHISPLNNNQYITLYSNGNDKYQDGFNMGYQFGYSDGIDENNIYKEQYYNNIINEKNNTIEELNNQLNEGFNLFTPVSAFLNMNLCTFNLFGTTFNLSFGLLLSFILGITAIFIIVKIFK